MVALLGRSGSGKSTLLNLIGGIDRPDAGTVEVAGRSLGRLSERELTRFRATEIGFVFQFFHLIPELTGEENVLLPARLARGRPPGRARALLDGLGLDGVAEQLPHTMSGGEQQRVAIARALVNEPRLVLADEPTGNLDPVSGATVLEALRAVASGERGVLLATHDDEAAALADRVISVENGRLRP